MNDESIVEKIISFAGDVSPGFARVLIYKDGKFTKHGDQCQLNHLTGNGRLINMRCVGAKALSSKGRVFVVWKNGEPETNVQEYIGEALFPSFQQLFI